MSESGFLCQGKRSFKKGDTKVREINLVQFASVVISSSIAPKVSIDFSQRMPSLSLGIKVCRPHPLRKKLKTK